MPTRRNSNSGFNSGGASTSYTINVSSTLQQSACFAMISAWVTGNNPFHLVSVTDNASGGSNTWTFSTADNNQNPPAAGAYDSGTNKYGFTAVAVCLPDPTSGNSPKPFTQVTVTMSATIPTSQLQVGFVEMTDMWPGSVIQDAASDNTVTTVGATYTTPSVTTTNGAVSIATTSYLGNMSSAGSGWSLEGAGSQDASKPSIPVGTTAVTFTPSSPGSFNLQSSAIIAVGPPVSAKTETFTDDFNVDDLATNWANGLNFGATTVAGGQMQLPCTLSGSGIRSTSDYDLTDSYVYAKVEPDIGTPGDFYELDFFVTTPGGSGSQATIYFLDGSLSFGCDGTSGPSITYDSAAHAYWRIRESGGTIFFDTSPDATTWTNQWSSTYTFDATNLQVGFYTTYGTPGVDGISYVDSVNIPNGVGGGGGGGMSTEIVWDAAGTHVYETGIDRGVLFAQGYDGVPWNGLTSVLEKPVGGTAQSYYLDGVKYQQISAYEEFAANISAFTYPDEFNECEGVAEINVGLYATAQPRKPFSLSYRTMVGDDRSGNPTSYKLHLVYNAIATPTQRNNKTMSGGVDPMDFSWDIATLPIELDRHANTAHLIIDSHRADPDALSSIEDILYGRTGSPSRMPTMLDLETIIDSHVTVLVIDNSDGTFTVSGPDGDVFAVSSDKFEIDYTTVVAVGSDRFQVSSL